MCTMPVKCTNYPGTDKCKPKCKKPTTNSFKKITFGSGSWPGYETTSSGENGAAMIVLQEWWGVNEEIKETALHIAEQGYRVLIPDVYMGKVALDTAEAAHLSSTLNWTQATNQMKDAAQYLRDTGSNKVGVVGFCMGGGLALCASQFAEVDAGASFYGLPNYARCQVDRIKVPVQLHFGDLDASFPPMVLNATVANLTAGSVDYELFKYPGAAHAFMNALTPRARAMMQAQRRVVPPESQVILAFERLTAFLAEYLV